MLTDQTKILGRRVSEAGSGSGVHSFGSGPDPSSWCGQAGRLWHVAFLLRRPLWDPHRGGPD